MTLLLLYMFLTDADQPELHIADPEIFQVMQADEAFVMPNGEAYILNFDESRVQYYGADGQLKKNIGGRGKGPGEFTFPSFFTVSGDRIYVFDELTTLLSVFSLDGTFKEHVRMPARRMEMAKGLGGWFYWEMSTYTSRGGPAVMKFSPDNFKTSKDILNIENTGWTAGTWVQSSDGKMKVTYSPLSPTPHLAASPDGKRVYYADPYLFKINVYNGETAELMYTIERDEPRLPFDTEWADEQFEENTQGVRKRNPGVEIEKLYPTHFPAIRYLRFDINGDLMVSRWRGRPEKKFYPVTYDAKGKEKKLAHDWNSIRRIAGATKTHAYVIMFEEDEDTGICKVPRAEAESFIKKHPITDWSMSRSISISD